MTTIETVVKKINAIDAADVELFGLFNCISEAFENYEYEGIRQVFLAKTSRDDYPWQCYVDHEHAPIVLIREEKGRLVAIEQ